MAASPAIDLGESLEALFKRARIADNFYRKCEGQLEEFGVGDAGDLLEVVALKGIVSLGIHELQAEKLVEIKTEYDAAARLGDMMP